MTVRYTLLNWSHAKKCIGRLIARNFDSGHMIFFCFIVYHNIIIVVASKNMNFPPNSNCFTVNVNC